VLCVIATGRMLTSARRIAGQLGISAPLVCYQGAMVGEADGTILRHDTLETVIAKALIRAIDEAGHEPIAFVDEQVYVARESETALTYSRNAGVPYNVVGDLAEWLPKPVTKLVAWGEPAAMDELRDHLVPLHGDEAFIAKSLPYYLEMAGPGVSKASGAQHVCDLLGIEAAACIAFGDGENDLELLEWAGYGVAVGGGYGPLLELADHVSESVTDEGVPRLLHAIARART
jgi:Cof subfamily protein (haloacid dehalogenase superfamily)